MATLKAPFNFVPLNKKVYIPSWAKGISQDIPFEDGLSGTLTIKIKAETPIFVGDGKQEENNQNEVLEFCNVVDAQGNKHYFIPGSSIKGAIRNVMEIISFGKMTQVQNQSFGIRDLFGGEDGDFYKGKVKVSTVHCGWLRLVGDGYLLDDCGFPFRISAEHIDGEYNNKGFKDFISDCDKLKNDDNRLAMAKYMMFENCNLDGTFEEYDNAQYSGDRRRFVNFSDNGNIRGTIVFTGQSSARTERNNKAKFYEFVFPSNVERPAIKISNELFEKFDTVHQFSKDYNADVEKDKEKRKEILKYTRKYQLSNGEPIPVFFTYDKHDNVEAIGLAYMFKYPARKSVYDGISASLKSKDVYDLCECIFGYISEDHNKKDSLKGRVQFSCAKVVGAPDLASERVICLSKPHPSYYPLYLGDGKTWNSDETIEIAGRKRYPVRGARYLLSNEGTDGMTKTIRPLEVGTKFVGKIHFHNLRPIELGALISSITFCNQKDCHHSLGQAKPLGYGRVEITIKEDNVKSLKDDTKYSIQNAFNVFCKEMENSISEKSYIKCMTELIAMSRGIPTNMLSNFSYMKMSTKPKENEFLSAKDDYNKKNERLGSFCQITNYSIAEFRDERRYQEKLSTISGLFEGKQYLDAEKELQLMLSLFKSKESIIKEYLEKINEYKKEASSLKNEADALCNDGKYEEAIKLYQKAAEYGFESYVSKINECREKIDEHDRYTSKIEIFLNTVAVASINAFSVQLKKRNDNVVITEADVEPIVNKIHTCVRDMNSKNRKSWLDRKKWAPIEKAIGQTLTDEIYNGLKQTLNS